MKITHIVILCCLIIKVFNVQKNFSAQEIGEYEMYNYYDLIMGSDPSSFLSIFNNLWKNEIKSQNLPYTHSFQITNGNRLRPILLAWGYYANCSSENNTYIAEYAVSIELLHKSSILLDDLIDDDVARHEKETFHVQFSESEALLYALYILNRSITLIHQKDALHNQLYTSSFLEIIDNMVKGGIKEISSKDNILNLADVKEIIDLETISLIKNSFILGHQLSSETPSDNMDDIISIGRSCGYCFQVLNDMEPFSAPTINQKYKGKINYDFSKSRKNIIISFLYGACTPQERKKIKINSNLTYIKNLIEKYDVLPILLCELESEINSIMQCITRLQTNNLIFYTDFKKFLINMFQICYQKCNLPFKNELLYN